MSISTDAESWRDETALNRHQIIAPLLDEGLDPQKKQMLREQQASKYGCSVRSIQRYEQAYRNGGFSGLKPRPQNRRSSPKLPPDFNELLQEAILLKREVPTRSVQQIIRILEMEGRAKPGTLARPTLQRHLHNAGFGKKQMRMYIESKNNGAGRFAKPHRMMLIQVDIKYGPKLPIGKNGAKVQTYLSAAIDDCTRYVVASAFYDNQEATIVEDTYRKVILRFGKFDKSYADNGKQYVSRQLRTSCAKLGIRIIHHRPYSASSKGKVEKFNDSVNDFIAEVNAAKVKTLEELNRLWYIWIEAYYHDKPHSGLGEGITPLMAFNRDTRHLTFLDVNLVAEAFLHHEKRNVDRSGCISFKGQKYEVGMSLVGATVEIAFDPMDCETLTVTYRDMPPFKAKPLHIGEFCGKSPVMPAHLLPKEPETSRFLDALESKHEQMKIRSAGAISFGSYRKEVDGDV